MSVELKSNPNKLVELPFQDISKLFCLIKFETRLVFPEVSCEGKDSILYDISKTIGFLVVARSNSLLPPVTPICWCVGSDVELSLLAQ